MSGNVAEVCLDWYDEYSGEDQVDPVGPDALPSDVPQNESVVVEDGIQIRVLAGFLLVLPFP